MAKNKFYVVTNGRKTGIFESWAECEEQIKGFSGAIFKGVPTLKDAEDFYNNKTEKIDNNKEIISIVDYNIKIDEAISHLSENEVIAFVDGSYSDEEKKSAFGVIIFDNKSHKEILYKAFPKEYGDEFIKTRNVGAELEGVKAAIEWALKYNKKQIQIYYDYEGIEKWANNEWEANNVITQKYVAFIKEKEHKIKIIFSKVPAHSGITYNEQADLLAKKALSEQGYKTCNDGSVYFVGYDFNKWKNIVNIINQETLDETSDVEVVQIEIQKRIQSKEIIKIKQGNTDVTINCYHGMNSYVQGKKTALFNKIISIAIEMLTSDVAIATLNKYHGLEITPENVEDKFKEFFPNYKNTGDDKIYNTLLSSCYNTMFTGYMPDYTCLVTPVFRGFEYCLHRILGDYMGLSTSNLNGKNNFSYFNKIGSLYECTNPATSKLSKNQFDYLSLLYNQYNSIRHQYSHWSANSMDTAVIDNIETAQKILREGIELINKFYINF